jgi:drug/metabolite transporter (DMT)-like permease
MQKIQSGQFLAILSASLFGVSPVLCKIIIGDMSPALLAGLLYLGSGMGLEMYLIIKGTNPLIEVRQISEINGMKLLAAILAGGVIAPICLTYGIKYGKTSEVTLLLNLETVATTIIAWLIFKEHISLRLWTGKIIILLAAAGVVIQTKDEITLSFPAILVVIACILWGLDNNLTREVEDISSVNLAGIKGLTAGIFNLFLARLSSQGSFTLFQLSGAIVIGALCYGLSLVLFVEALRRIGAARTSTFFTVGPFIGTLLSILILRESEPISFWIAMSLMLIGVLLLYKERHGHIHAHELLFHRHRHTHDEHHQHSHSDHPMFIPHEHAHDHEPLTHIHRHLPDIHHRHVHEKSKSDER